MPADLVAFGAGAGARSCDRLRCVEGAATALVGRKHEFARLEGFLDASMTAGGVATLVGPPGIGKTRLAEAVGQRARDRGLDVHWATCWVGPGGPVLQPWVEIVRDVTGHDLPVAHTRFEFVDRVVRLLRGAAAERPRLVVLDDAHAADDESLQLLEHVVRTPRGPGLAVLVTYRLAEAVATHRLETLARVARDATVVGLGGLDAAGVRSVAASVGEQLSDEEAVRLHALTGGNPLFVREMVRSLGHDRRYDIWETPATIADVVRGHLALATADVRAVLVAAAVQGTAFARDVVAEVIGHSLDVVDAALAEAARLGLVVEVRPHERFSHPLIGEILVADADVDHRRRLHLATADALASGGDATAASVAGHLAAAGPLADDERAAEAARRAAAIAGRRFASGEAARWLDVAVQRTRRRDPRRAAELLVELSTEEQASGRRDAARSSALEAAEVARKLDDVDLLARAAVAMPPDSEGIEVDQLADPDQLALREEAAQRLPDDDALAARVLAALAMSLYWAESSGDRARDHRATTHRRDHLTAVALDRARRSGDPKTMGVCIGARLYALWGPDAPPDRGELISELAVVSSRVGDPRLELEARAWAVVDALATGDLERAVTAADLHRRLAETLRHPVHRWTAHRWQASLMILEGRIDEAETLAAAALELGQELIEPGAAFAFWSVQIAFIRYLQGRLGELHDAMRVAAEDPASVPAWRCGLVLSAVAAGDDDLARRELRSLAADRFAVLPRDLDWLSALTSLAPAVHALRNRETATVLAALLAPHADEHGIVGLGYASYGPVRRALAILAVTRDELDAAVDHLERALASLQPAHRTFRALALVDLADALAMRGRPSDRERARGALRDARPLAFACGLAATTRRIDEMEDRLGRLEVVALADRGDHWELRHGDRPVVHLRPLRGFVLLRELLRFGEEIHALELLAACEPPENPDPALRRAVAASRGEEVLDRRARHEYRRRIDELRAELDAADTAGDPARSALAARELEALHDELRRAGGLGDRPRRATDATERARVRATKLLARAVEAITEADADLGAHLRASLRTGARCAYEPPRDSPYRWQVT